MRLQAELVATDRLATVGKLAAGVAHEVGNPLAGILGYVSVIRMRLKASDATGSAELTDLVDRIEGEVQRIDGIVRSLLELGRPSRGAASAIDVRTVIDSSVKLLGASREFEGVKIQLEAPPSRPVMIALPAPAGSPAPRVRSPLARIDGGASRTFHRQADVHRRPSASCGPATGCELWPREHGARGVAAWRNRLGEALRCGASSPPGREPSERGRRAVRDPR